MQPGRKVRHTACAAVVACAIAGCSLLTPERREHPIVGTYDVTMSFQSTSTRGPCSPPGPGMYCYTTDSVAFTRTGLLSFSDASAVEGPATFAAEITLGADDYETILESGAIPTIDASGTFTVPYLRRTDGYEFIYLKGALQTGVGISGTVSKGNGPYYQSTGTFTGLRRP